MLRLRSAVSVSQVRRETSPYRFKGIGCLLDIYISRSFLSRLRRAKSLSTPSLAAAPKQARGQCPGLSSGHAAAVCWPRFSLHPSADPGEERKRREPSVSKVEQQRQQILEEMKKRTQLLTDNSWIRQRSSSVYKEPIYVPLKRPAWLSWTDAPPLSFYNLLIFSCRFESLDNLDTFQHSSALHNYPRPHSAAAGYYSPSRNPSRYSTGSVLPRANDPTRPVRYTSR